jgi:peptidoglycan/xylan/chitin deacetylase (PgdA/CDA1 family)
MGEDRPPQREGPGGLVISLDFEIHWGVRDRTSTDGPYRANLLGEREAVPRMLELFQEFGIAATWATVGFLFAGSRGEIERHAPRIRPLYSKRSLVAYDQATGEGEEDDPFHFAPSLIEAIRLTPRQEIATHTFSHYYCLEAGQTARDFDHDLRSAVSIAAACGVRLQSIVFPRNQHNPAYDDILREAGISCYRGTATGWMHRPVDQEATTRQLRAARLLDSYASLSGDQTIAWEDVAPRNGLSDVRASFFLRPYTPRLRHLEALRLRRITASLERAAKGGRLLHLWWHPHNFGTHTSENIAFLRRILATFDGLRATRGMQSYSMRDAAEMAASLPR